MRTGNHENPAHRSSASATRRFDDSGRVFPHGLLRRTDRLGWFGVGLGVIELLAPRTAAHAVGTHEHGSRRLLRLFGARQLTAGLGILSRRRTAGWMWARVAGDVLDLATLARMTRRSPSERSRGAVVAAAVASIAALDFLTAVQLTRKQPGPLARGLDVKESITVNRSPAELYARFRRLEDLPRFLSHLESVVVHGSARSTWRAKTRLGMAVEWETEITEDVPDTLIAWRSLPEAAIPNRGSVRFRPARGKSGTEVQIHLKYELPGGAFAKTVATMFGEEPSLQVAADLRRFKRRMEDGDETRESSSALLRDSGA
jgi:uncharacterized membrane protein